MMKNFSPEKLRALGVLCSLAAIAIVVAIMFGGSAVPLGWPASAQDAQKPWVMELP